MRMAAPLVLVVLVAVTVRAALYRSSLAAFISERVEVASPLNAWKRGEAPLPTAPERAGPRGDGGGAGGRPGLGTPRGRERGCRRARACPRPGSRLGPGPAGRGPGFGPGLGSGHFSPAPPKAAWGGWWQLSPREERVPGGCRRTGGTQDRGVATERSRLGCACASGLCHRCV